MSRLYSFIKTEWNHISKKKAVHQTLVNSFVYALTIPIGIIISSIIVRNIGAEDYGKLTLLITLVTILSVIVGFGYTVSYARIQLINEEKKRQQELLGLGIFMFLVQSLLLFGLFIIVSPFISLLYGISISKALLAVSVPSSLYVFHNFFLHTTRASNHMYWTAFHKGIQPLLYLLFIVLGFALFTIEYSNIFLFLLLSTYLPIITYIILQKPTFSSLKKHWNSVKAEQKRFGIHIYITQILEKISYKLDDLMLGTISFQLVGYYNLGFRLTQPISTVSKKFTDAYTKEFNTKTKIPNKIILYNILFWMGSSILLLLFAHWIIVLLWGNEFLVILNFLWILLISTLFSNLYYLIYLFLFNKGVGKKQKKHFIFKTLSNLIGNSILIPLFGIMGAVVATCISNILFFFSMVYEYIQYRKQLS